MKYLSPLLDVILGMLLVFVSIAAVSGAADGEGEVDETPQSTVDPVVLELSFDREPSPMTLGVRDGGKGEYRSLRGVEDLALDHVDEIELTVRDADLYRVLHELELRGTKPKVLFEKR